MSIKANKNKSKDINLTNCMVMHQSFETPGPPPPSPSGMTGAMRGLSLHIHQILVPR